MIPRKPPALATWLLRRFRLPETNAPLTGDLLEEFQSGRSRLWYWVQTLAAIAMLPRRNARTSRGRLTAIFGAWLVQAAIAQMLWRLHLLPPRVRPLYLALGALVVVTHGVIAGIALGQSGIRKLRSALGRLAYWTLLPFLETAYFLRVRRRGLQTDAVADAADTAVTIWSSAFSGLLTIALIALFAGFPDRADFLVLELLILANSVIGEIARPRPRAL